MSLIIFWIIILILLGLAFYLPIRAIRNWQGGWRIAAYVPLLLVATVLFIVIIGKGGNLFPFVIIIYSGLSLIISAIMYVAHILFKKVAK